ncbi:DUF86 domain-containing protein [Flavobacterium azooxidireducens]|uniref:DUF86 domain-containing protein n=1 Tax=Flavobacterium azooxidireducens TaxID=1871076 RepID=A0ABY4KJ46_9FLAO|nr:DUF86 domain-containing protein [Flavobacterium azooxidireducens]UPQ80840.1 DUF86 domain-containing protein [Flavobacterium azooxidireducens]
MESFFFDSGYDFSEYKRNNMKKRAIERNLEIIGEALNRIVKKESIYLKKITDCKSIIGLRNHVIHIYDNVSDENIWSILINHLPKLKEEVDSLLS